MTILNLTCVRIDDDSDSSQRPKAFVVSPPDQSPPGEGGIQGGGDMQALKEDGISFKAVINRHWSEIERDR